MSRRVVSARAALAHAIEKFNAASGRQIAQAATVFQSNLEDSMSKKPAAKAAPAIPAAEQFTLQRERVESLLRQMDDLRGEIPSGVDVSAVHDWAVRVMAQGEAIARRAEILAECANREERGGRFGF